MLLNGYQLLTNICYFKLKVCLIAHLTESYGAKKKEVYRKFTIRSLHFRKNAKAIMNGQRSR